MRENLKRCLVRRAEMTRSGAPATSLPKCKYFNQLQFINDKVLNKETDSNLVICPQNPVESPNESSLLSTDITNSINIDDDYQPKSKLKRQQTVIETATTSSSSQSQSKNINKSKKKTWSQNEANDVDSCFLNVLENINNTTKSIINPKEDIEGNLDNDEDSLFCRSLIPILKKLDRKENRIAKIKIQELLCKLEFESDE